MPQDPGLTRSTMDVLMAHRSVRAFTETPLDDGLLEQLVVAGTRASTSSNMQTYSVISISQSSRRKRLAALCSDQKQIHQAAAFLVFCADLHKVKLACEMNDIKDANAGYAEALITAVVDTALVMQNVAVAAESLGLGVCMIGAVRNDPHEVAELLMLPRWVVAIAGMCIGHPADEGEVRPRMPLAGTLHPEHYRRTDELQAIIAQYDITCTEWSKRRGSHAKDPRWSAAMGKRLPEMANRAALTHFLRQKGLNTR